MWRAPLLVLLLAMPLGGCGFSPLYAPVAGHAAAGELAHVYVAVIPDRSGQELREALRRRLEGATGPLAPRYTLSVGYALTNEGIGIDPDTNATFTRYHGQAIWRLLGPNPAAPPLASGVATAEDGFSNIVNQYFYGSLAGDAISERMADALAEQIVVRLASWFRASDRTAAK